MKHMAGPLTALGLAAAIVIGQGEQLLHAQNATDPNAAPNPYRMEELRVQLPDGRKLGAPIGVGIDHSDGKTLWLFERCGGDTCVGSTVDPVMKLDASGKVLANFGGGLVNWPHGFMSIGPATCGSPMDVAKTAKGTPSPSFRLTARYS